MNQAMLNVLMDMQERDAFDANNKVLLNPTLSQIGSALQQANSNNLQKEHKHNIANWINFINDYKNDETARRIFDIVQDCSLATPPKTKKQIEEEVLALYTIDNNEDGTAKELQAYINDCYNLQKSWERAVQLRSSGRGKSNQYGTLAIVLGSVGVTGLVASSIWLHHILNPNNVTTSTAKKVTEGQTETDTSQQTEASQSDVEIPEQPEAGTTRNMDTTGSSDAASTAAQENAATQTSADTNAADTIAQGDATSATDIAAEAADANAAADASQANLQGGAGTLIAVCSLLILATLFVLYLYYKTEKDRENNVSDDIKGNVFDDKAPPSSKLLDFSNIIEKPQQSNIGDDTGTHQSKNKPSHQQSQTPDDLSETPEQGLL